MWDVLSPLQQLAALSCGSWCTGAICLACAVHLCSSSHSLSSTVSWALLAVPCPGRTASRKLEADLYFLGMSPLSPHFCISEISQLVPVLSTSMLLRVSETRRPLSCQSRTWVVLMRHDFLNLCFFKLVVRIDRLRAQGSDCGKAHPSQV